MPSDLWLNLELLDSTGEPLSGRPYVLTLPDGSQREGELDEDGRLHESVPPSTEPLSLYVAHRRIVLNVGQLPDPRSVQGVQERLNHLNYFTGDVDGDAGRFTRAALERFQRDQGLPVTGEADEVTVQALVGVHGS